MATRKLSSMKLSSLKLSNSGGTGGNAQPTDVLAPNGFTNDDGEQVGTMPENGALNVTPTAAAQNFGAGHYTGIAVASAPANMKSYQSGITNWNDTTTTKDITISAVSTALVGTVAIVRITYAGTGDLPSNVTATGILLNATTIRITRTTGLAISLNFMIWEVIEFQNVKSMQTGSLSLSSGVNSITISSVNAQKTMPFAMLRNSSGTAGNNQWNIASRLQDSVTLSVVGYNTNDFVVWQVIEFN